MNYDERIEQCGVDITILLNERERLIKECKEQEAAKEIEWEHGDTANCRGYSTAPRLFIRGPKGLMLFDMTDGSVLFPSGSESAKQHAAWWRYVKTGNIFCGGK